MATSPTRRTEGVVVDGLAHDVAVPAIHRLLQLPLDIGVVVAGGDADLLGRADGFEPVVSGVDLGIERQVHQVAGDHGEIRVLLAHVAHQLGQAVARHGMLALDLPVEEAGDPLVHQIARPDRRQRGQVNVGQMSERYHCWA